MDQTEEKVVLKIKERAYQIIIALLVLACLGVGMSDPHVVSEKNKMTQKIVLIRDDDVKDDTAALEWMTNTIIAKDAKCTYATIPHLLTQSGITYLKSLDPARFELATHGYDHTETENQVAVMATAKDLMIADFGRVPTSIAPPYEIVPPGFADEAKKLGYHSQINGNIGSSTGLYTFPFNFRWESGWNQYNASYHSLDDFKKSFDGWYNNSSRRVFTINVHHADLYENAGAMKNFSSSLDYMNDKSGIFFTTEEETYLEVTKVKNR